MNRLTPPAMSGWQYALWGVGLMLVKYFVEYLVVTINGGAEYNLLQFLMPLYGGRDQAIASAAPWVVWFILIWSLPFVFVAIWFSMGRAIDAGLSPWTSLWILAPYLNFLFMILMCFLPHRTPDRQRRQPASKGPDTTGQTDTTMWITTILLGLLMTASLIVLSIFVFADYGATIFFTSPILLGAICGYSQTKYRGGSQIGKAMLVAMAALAIGMATLVAIGFEGTICILMAMPIMLPAAAIGGIFGFIIAKSTLTGPPWMTIALILPSAAVVEFYLTQPVQYEVVSVVQVDASPDEVWERVIAFPEITAQPDLLSRLGVAYPVRARIEGRGVGAVRYCEFSTGDFVEPITVWDPPNRLAFDVEDQPCPLTELSPWEDIHPPHLDGFMRSHRGEFRLTELPNGKTRLAGHTVYSVDMYPQLYWKLWTDSIIHSIHHRVLEHIADVVKCE
jgi:hypothetical protein